MITLADRVRETTTTTGVGNYSLAGAEAGFQTFVAGAGNGETVFYCCTDGTDWETGIGTVTDAAPDTLSRDTILASSNGGAAVNWGSGEKDIFLTVPEFGVGFRGALVTMSGDEGTVSSTDEVLDWDTETYDVGGWHSGANPSRLTVPAGVSRVRISWQVRWEVDAAGGRQVLTKKNGAIYIAGGGSMVQIPPAGAPLQTIMAGQTAVVEVAAGDYFELRVYQTSGGNLNVESAATWFSIEKVGP
jgi:hypothetical protein